MLACVVLSYPSQEIVRLKACIVVISNILISFVGMEKGTKSRDYNRSLSLTNLKLFQTVSKALDLLSLNYSALRDLATICDYHKNFSCGIRSSGIVKSWKHTDGSYPALYRRLQLLESKGLVYIIDNYYYPSDKAIKLLNSITV